MQEEVDFGKYEKASNVKMMKGCFLLAIGAIIAGIILYYAVNYSISK